MRTVKKIHSAERDDIGDLVTRRALPTSSLEHLDPFLFLNHHGPQIYPADNRGLPFGPHPHRGFETVTFILKGSLAHKDTGGHESIIHEGGVQWMTAGRGLVHSEISPEEFLESGGPLEILQLWVNLPSRLKMTDPKYQGLQKEEIPLLEEQDGAAKLQLVSGAWGSYKGAFDPLVDIDLKLIELRAQSQMQFEIEKSRSIFFYVVRGAVEINTKAAKTFELVEFAQDHSLLKVQAESDALILLGHAEPFNEPIVSYGPFVMNSREQIMEAMRDYQQGKFG